MGIPWHRGLGALFPTLPMTTVTDGSPLGRVQMNAKIQFDERPSHHRRAGDKPVDRLRHLVRLADALEGRNGYLAGLAFGERLRREAFDEALLEERRANGIHPDLGGQHARE